MPIKTKITDTKFIQTENSAPNIQNSVNSKYETKRFRLIVLFYFIFILLSSDL